MILYLYYIYIILIRLYYINHFSLIIIQFCKALNYSSLLSPSALSFGAVTLVRKGYDNHHLS